MKAFLLALTIAVNLFSGDKVYFDLGDTPVTTFEDHQLVITTSQAQVMYPLSEVNNFTYEEYTEGIASTDASRLVIRQNKEMIAIEGLSEQAPVELYALDGTLLTRTQAKASQTTELPLGGYANGTYIIHAGGTSYKFIKQ